MPFSLSLKPNQTISNKEMQEIFGCGNMGGMRKSNLTNSLVLISDYTKNLYEDRWIENTLHYTGMGKRGDQTLCSQNKTLYYSNENGVLIYLLKCLSLKDILSVEEYVFLVHLIKKNNQTKKGKIERSGCSRLSL